MATRLADVQGRKKRSGDLVNGLARSADKVIVTMMDSCEDADVRNVGAIPTAWVGVGERAILGDGVRL